MPDSGRRPIRGAGGRAGPRPHRFAGRETRGCSSPWSRRSSDRTPPAGHHHAGKPLRALRVHDGEVAFRTPIEGRSHRESRRPRGVGRPRASGGGDAPLPGLHHGLAVRRCGGSLAEHLAAQVANGRVADVVGPAPLARLPVGAAPGEVRAEFACVAVVAVASMVPAHLGAAPATEPPRETVAGGGRCGGRGTNGDWSA